MLKHDKERLEYLRKEEEFARKQTEWAREEREELEKKINDNIKNVQEILEIIEEPKLFKTYYEEYKNYQFDSFSEQQFHLSEDGLMQTIKALKILANEYKNDSGFCIIWENECKTFDIHYTGTRLTHSFHAMIAELKSKYVSVSYNHIRDVNKTVTFVSITLSKWRQ